MPAQEQTWRKKIGLTASDWQNNYNYKNEPDGKEINLKKYHRKLFKLLKMEKWQAKMENNVRKVIQYSKGIKVWRQ